MYTKINDDLKTAMKSGEKDLRDFLKVVKSEIQRTCRKLVAIPTDDECLIVLKKMKKNAGETGNLKEIAWLNVYLPKLMSVDEITAIVETCIEEGKNNIGLIMKHFNVNFKGKVDNKIVSQVAKEKLNS